ncbi:CsgG/HfaB family protein [Pontiella sulfatireligans]|uniref:Lipoprotein/NMB1164 n=1 Tax=Pontiella sulfatireligans TaxID=2750658 RepID=A0A6C2UUH7_9BACT|nr:CsgG/HfaB family protein [Pontiella sulfatireligans]VGO22546.1 Putative lipoprotein/NMB1164 [Pontiella sulfatireligans]
MKNKLLQVFAPIACTALLFGCATRDGQPQVKDSSVSRQAQQEAQQRQALPAKPRFKRKVAIGRFSNETRYGRSLLRDDDNDPLGKQVSDILAGRLVESDRFLVFERPDINKLKAESALTGQALDIIGVDTMIFGSLTEFGHSTTGKKGFLSATKKQTAEATVELRLVDVKTGHVFFTAKGSGTATLEAGQIAGYGSKANYDATLNDKAIDAAVSDLLNTLIRKLEERAWRTDILKIDNRQAFISGGVHQGIKAGDVFAVMSKGEPVKSKQSGFNIELPATKVGTIEVLSTFGSSEANEGAVAKIVEGSFAGSPLESLFVAEAGE